MQLRKLDVNEHIRTRKLWEKVFPEDGREFLDYYYFIKTRDNQIYVIEEDGDIRSMLQLNPYRLQIENEVSLCHYIIAVATEEEYRKRGYMGKLLQKAMQDMYAEKEPFTFLMPAAEAIYTPYDFRFIYAQNQAESYGMEGEPSAIIMEAGPQDVSDMAEFFNANFAGDYQVYAVRDANYYQTMIFEQHSENGGVKLLKKDGDIVGMFAYACEEHTVEIREPLYLPEYEEDFLKEIYKLRNENKTPVKIFAAKGSEDILSGQRKLIPIIMVRILHLPTLLSVMKVREGEPMDCSFAVLDSIITQNSRIWRLQGGIAGPEIQVRETEDSEGVLPISALTEFLFGYRTLEEISEEKDVILSEHLLEELKKIQPMDRVYLNEIV